MIYCIKNIKPYQEEDIYFSDCLHNKQLKTNFSVAPFEIAKMFSIETVASTKSVGLHIIKRTKWAHIYISLAKYYWKELVTGSSIFL